MAWQGEILQLTAIGRVGAGRQVTFDFGNSVFGRAGDDTRMNIETAVSLAFSGGWPRPSFM